MNKPAPVDVTELITNDDKVGNLLVVITAKRKKVASFQTRTKEAAKTVI